MFPILTPIIATGFFILGLIIGSFLNVVISRFNTGKSLGGRSACMTCRNKLRWYDLVPLLSFAFLKGRCRTCKNRISFIYPVIETVTGFIFLLIFLKFKDVFFISTSAFVVAYVYYTAVFSVLVVVAAYDFRHKIIPDTFSFIFSFLAFLGLFFFVHNGFFGFYAHIPSVLDLLSGLLVALPFALLWVVSAGAWMGLGDAKIALGIGWLLGISLGFSALTLAFWAGAVAGLFLMFFSKNYRMKSEIPFALYLVLGTFLAFILEIHLFSAISF